MSYFKKRQHPFMYITVNQNYPPANTWHPEHQPTPGIPESFLDYFNKTKQDHSYKVKGMQKYI